MLGNRGLLAMLETRKMALVADKRARDFVLVAELLQCFDHQAETVTA